MGSLIIRARFSDTIAAAGFDLPGQICQDSYAAEWLPCMVKIGTFADAPQTTRLGSTFHLILIDETPSRAFLLIFPGNVARQDKRTVRIVIINVSLISRGIRLPNTFCAKGLFSPKMIITQKARVFYTF